MKNKKKQILSVPLHVIAEEKARLENLLTLNRYKDKNSIMWKIGLCKVMIEAGEKYIKEN